MNTWLCEMKSTRVVAILCLLAFGWIAWLSHGFPPPLNPVDVGPGKVPTLIAYLGMICSVVLFVQAGRITTRIELRRPAAVASGMLVIAGYVLLIPFVGFYITSVFAVPALMLVGGERRPLRLLLSSTGFVLFIYLCFQLLLGVEFP
ncbi:tripartite tricarboxylate transporter TctB family protein [Advenella sp. S44]|uniref:tripartite tricarboxylate transporter TctB family protein n=1 Tax=Advenella sp. S44 TaxID=1982755 RepID=UPI001374729A|nr:tripartite tricarboxylate transporter TctB family protein [Advenella sp. S44]